MTDQTDILLSRYFAGEASELELRLLDEWLAESEEHEAYFDQMTMLYQQAAMQPDITDIDTTGALALFKEHISPSEVKKETKKIKFTRWHASVAAVALVLIGLFTFYVTYRAPQVVQVASGNIIESYLLSEEAEIILEPNSQIEYVSNKKNEIKLQGKATFVVQNESEEKLLVRAGETFIRDIGTTFSVTAYDTDEIITVEVTEGEVLFYTHDDEGVKLKQDEKATYNVQTREFQVFPVENELGEIVFTSASLQNVINLLEERYLVNIELADPALKHLQINVSFDKDESIETILDIISETLELQIKREKKRFIVFK